MTKTVQKYELKLEEGCGRGVHVKLANLDHLHFRNASCDDLRLKTGTDMSLWNRERMKHGNTFLDLFGNVHICQVHARSIIRVIPRALL